MNRSSGGIVAGATALGLAEVGQRAQHVADGVAQLAVGLDVVFRIFLPMRWSSE